MNTWRKRLPHKLASLTLSLPKGKSLNLWWGAAERLIRPAVLLLLLALSVHPVHAQGCAQCLDSTRATPPQVQAAYRHAIFLLGGFGTTLFVGGAVLLAKSRSS